MTWLTLYTVNLLTNTLWPRFDAAARTTYHQIRYLSSLFTEAVVTGSSCFFQIRTRSPATELLFKSSRATLVVVL